MVGTNYSEEGIGGGLLLCAPWWLTERVDSMMCHTNEFVQSHFSDGNRLYFLRACFPTARSPTARVVRQSLWRDVTFLGLQC